MILYLILVSAISTKMILPGRPDEFFSSTIPKRPVHQNDRSEMSTVMPIFSFSFQKNLTTISERFLLQIAQDIKSGNSVVMILQDRTFHQISKLGQ